MKLDKDKAIKKLWELSIKELDWLEEQCRSVKLQKPRSNKTERPPGPPTAIK